MSPHTIIEALADAFEEEGKEIIRYAGDRHALYWKEGRPMNQMFVIEEALRRAAAKLKPAEPEKDWAMRYYVLASGLKQFGEWVEGKENYRKYVYLVTADQIPGIRFNSPDIELIALPGWEEGRNIEFITRGRNMIMNYCSEKNVKEVPSQ